MTIKYHPVVVAELLEIRDFYNERPEGLGTAFVDEFEHFVFNISSMPAQYLMVKHGIRRALMKRFPYVIFFREVSSQKVRITTWAGESLPQTVSRTTR